MGGPQAVPPQDAVLMMLSLIRHQMMVLIKKRLLNLRFKLHLPMRGWRHAIPGTGNRKQPQKYIPSMQSNKKQVALAQITTSLSSVRHQTHLL